MPDLVGKTLGKYQIIERLGRGGMAEVYRAFQPTMNRFVAVKVMLPHLAEDEGFTERFQREATLVGQLRHPNIVQVIDFDIHNEQYYMVMEYIQGQSLKDRLRKGGALSPAEALDVTIKMADALAYAHNEGMLHRDLKPANILFTKKDEPVLTDFGVAKIIGQTGMTASGALVGTPAYMSPEAGRGEKVDERTDIYSLGIVLYETLTGQVPFDADTPLAIIFKHIAEPLPLIQGVPQPIEGLLLRMLAKNPEDRFRTAGELRDALIEARSQITGELPTRAASPTPRAMPASSGAARTTPSTIVPASAPGGAPTTMPGTLPPPAPVGSSSNRLVIGLFGLVAVGLVIVIALLVVDRGRDRGGPGPEPRTIVAGAASNTPLILAPATETAATEPPRTALAALATTQAPPETVAVGSAATDMPPTAAPTAADGAFQLTGEAPAQTVIAVAPPGLPSEVVPSATEAPPTLPPTLTPTFTATATPDYTPTPYIVAAAPEGFAEFRDEVRRLMRNGNYDVALEVVGSALAEASDAYMPAAMHAYVLVRYREDAEKLELGRTEAERAIGLDPTRPEAYGALGIYYNFSPIENFEAALDNYTAAIERGTDDPDIFVLRAEVRDRLGAESEAAIIADFTQAVLLAPDSTYYLDARSQFYRNHGLLAEAEADLRKAQALDFGYWRTRNLGSVLMGQRKAQEAYDMYAALIAENRVTEPVQFTDAAFVALAGGRLEESRAWAETALTIDPGMYSGRYILALLDMQAQEWESALSHLDYVASAPNTDYAWPFLNRFYNREVNLDRGRVLVALRRLDEAHEAFSRAIDVNGYWAVPYVGRALVNHALGRTLDARSDVRQALDILKDNPDERQVAYLTALLNALRDGGEVPTPLAEETRPTVVAYEPTPTPEPTEVPVPVPDPEAVARNKIAPEYESVIVEAYQLDQNGQREEALAMIEDALGNAPDSYDLTAMHAYLLVWFRDDWDRMELGRIEAERAIGINPDRPEAYYILGLHARFALDNRWLAVEHFTQAIDRSATDPATYAWRAWTNSDLGTPPEVVLADFAAAVALDPENYYWHEARADYLFSIWRHGDAIPDLEFVIEVRPWRNYHGKLAIAYLQAERAEDALALYERNIESAEQEGDARYLADGAFLANWVDKDEIALNWIERSLAIYPKEASALYMKAVFAVQSEEYREALNWINRVIGGGEYEYGFTFLTPMYDHDIRLDRARMLAKLGRYQEAAMAYRIFRQRINWWSTPYLEAAEIFVQLGDIDSAREWLLSGLEIASRNGEVEVRDRALNMLRSLPDSLFAPPPAN